MWPFTQKRSLRLAVFSWIAVRMSCISRSNGSGYPCKENLYPFERLGLSMRKNLSSNRTGRAVCSKKLCSKINLSRVSISQSSFVASHSSWTRYSWVVTLRRLFTNASWIVKYLFLLLYSHLRFHCYRRCRRTIYSILKFFSFQQVARQWLYGCGLFSIFGFLLSRGSLLVSTLLIIDH